VIMTTASEVALVPAHLDRITKPFDRRTLLAKIEASLGGLLAGKAKDGREAS